MKKFLAAFVFVLFASLTIGDASFAAYQTVGDQTGKATITSYSPAVPVLANATVTANYHRDKGNGQMVIQLHIAWTGANGGAGAAFKVPLPSGYTFCQTCYPSGSTYDGTEQTAQKFDTGGEFFNSGTNIEFPIAMAFDTSTLTFDLAYVGLFTDNRPSTNDVLDVTIRVWVNGPGY